MPIVMDIVQFNIFQFVNPPYLVSPKPPRFFPPDARFQDFAGPELVSLLRSFAQANVKDLQLLEVRSRQMGEGRKHTLNPKMREISIDDRTC